MDSTDKVLVVFWIFLYLTIGSFIEIKITEIKKHECIEVTE